MTAMIPLRKKCGCALRFFTVVESRGARQFGICGQCKTKFLAGHVTMETQDALTPADRANNLILSCQARCIDQVAVDA